MDISYSHCKAKENNDLSSSVEDNELILIQEDDSFVNSIHEQISTHYDDFPELLVQERESKEDYFFN